MSNNDRTILRLKHIISAISDIEIISEQGIEDKKTYYSIVYLIQIIGEAATNLDEKIKTKYNQVSWKEIISMRNFIAHEYDKIDLNIVKDTVKHDIPVLKTQMQNILKDLST